MRIPAFIETLAQRVERATRRPLPPAPAPVENVLEGIRDLFSPDRPESTAVPKGYGRPIRARDLPPPGEGLRVVTYNAAQGAKLDAYRSGENRADQARLLNEVQAGVIAFQEVDQQLDRSGDVNTALDVVRRLNPALAPFAEGSVPAQALNGGLVEAGDMRPALLQGADGTTVHESGGGALVNANVLDASLRPVRGDNEGSYGMATYVAPPFELTEAYTYLLPRTAEAGLSSQRERISGLADGPLSASERAELSDANVALREAKTAQEPRAALVTRVRDPRNPEAPERSIINVHLSTDAAVREAQMEVVAELVRAESSATPPREVVLLGDFNAQPVELEEVMARAGMRRVVGSPNAPADERGTANIDLVWVSRDAETEASAQLKTEGTTDHVHAGTTTLR